MRAAHGDRPFARRATGKHLVEIVSSQAKESGIAEQAVFDDLRIACSELAHGKRIEQAGCRRRRENRLMERADEILAVARVDRGLAAHRGIDLGEQRRRNLDVIQPAPHDGGSEAREVTDHAAAERDDEVATFRSSR